MISRFTNRAVGVAAATAMALMPVAGASAASLIRDAEIEATLRAYADPIFEAAGLDADAVQVHIINDPQINAFVSGGLQMFVHTGLLTAAEKPNEVIGVIAHETGHIAGGHLVRAQEAIENATIETIIGALVGVAVGVLTGEGGPAIAAEESIRMMALRNLMTYSRAQEGVADQTAYRLLEATGQAPDGMASFFRVLQRQEALSTERQDPYLRSHPLATSRIDAAEAAVARSAFAGKPNSPELMMRHQRMLAKLNGYLKPNQVATLYPKSDQSVPARYARAIALYRTSHMDEAVAIMDGLIAEAPQDPFFLEQKAQILLRERPRRGGAAALPAGARSRARRAADPPGAGAGADPAGRDGARAATADRSGAAACGDRRSDQGDAPRKQECRRVQAAGDRLRHARRHGDGGPVPGRAMAGERRRGKGQETGRACAGSAADGHAGWLRAQDIQFVADQRDEDGYEFTSPVSQASLQ